MKWTKLEPYAEKYSIENAFKRKGTPINVTIKKVRGRNAVRIMARVGEGITSGYVYDYIFEDEDTNLYKLIKKAMKEAEKDA